MLDGQDVVRVLGRDQELGVLALGVQRVGGDHRPGQLQRRQQRRKGGDFVGLAVHLSLGEYRAGLLVCRGQQVAGLAIAAGMPGAAHRLAVYRHRPPLPQPRR
jgi:hypothetical protein